MPALWFTAVLSINLGLINLFPIPMLDGGHLVFHAYEAVTGRPPSENALRRLGAEQARLGHPLTDTGRRAVISEAMGQVARPVAFGVAITHRADAMALLAAHYDRAGLPFNEARQRMARIPDGAVLIDNPISVAPGFILGNVHVMAGVPNIFESMLASVLPRLTGGAPLLSQNLRVMRGEGEIAGDFGRLAEEYPDLSMGSYPFQQNGAFGTNLVIRGTDPGRLDQAMMRLVGMFG